MFKENDTGMVSSMSTIAVNGFSSWNKFEKEMKRLHQLYDFTYHLYLEEHEKLKGLIRRNKNGKISNPYSLHTQVKSITHSVQSLQEYTKKQFPSKLRELILISIITSLEVFLSDMVFEISGRTLTPFKRQEPVDFIRGEVLTTKRIDKLKTKIINADIRKLTSGGLKETEKYYKKNFNIDFKTIDNNFDKITEFHERRHLYVHRGGKCDSQYLTKFPNPSLKVGQQIITDNEYMINVFETITNFASNVKDSAILNYPVNERKKKSFSGKLQTYNLNSMYIVKVDSLSSANIENIIRDLKIYYEGKEIAIIDFVAQVIIEDTECSIVIGANDKVFKFIMKTLRQCAEVEVFSVNKLFPQS